MDEKGFERKRTEGNRIKWNRIDLIEENRDQPIMERNGIRSVASFHGEVKLESVYLFSKCWSSFSDQLFLTTKPVGSPRRSPR